MIIDDDAKLYVYSDVTTSLDPTGSTVELEVDGTRYPMVWQGSAVQSAGRWKQTARTTAKFCGSSTTATGSDVKLTVGAHASQVIVTATDGQVVPGTNDTLQVG